MLKNTGEHRLPKCWDTNCSKYAASSMFVGCSFCLSVTNLLGWTCACECVGACVFVCVSIASSWEMQGGVKVWHITQWFMRGCWNATSGGKSVAEECWPYISLNFYNSFGNFVLFKLGILRVITPFVVLSRSVLSFYLSWLFLGC